MIGNRVRFKYNRQTKVKILHSQRNFKKIMELL